MTEGKRPGGLTAMAVINFVFGGFACLGILGILMMIVMKDRIDDPEFQRQVAQIPEGMLYVMLGVNALVATLLIVSGIGYLKQKRIMGRVLGNVYALLTLGSVGIGIAFSTFTLLNLVDVIYPTLTLILLNTTFKDDFIR